MKPYWNGLTDSYEFDTGEITGCIEPHSNYHGIAGLVHRSDKVNLVRPKKAFLNAEYYLQANSGPQMLPRDISRTKKTTHQQTDDAVEIHFPAEPEYGFALDLVYKAHGDMIDMAMTISPTKDIASFEIFFASYVCEAMDETWIPLKDAGSNEKWVKLDNRKVINNAFGVVKDDSRMEILNDGRWGAGTERPHFSIEETPFSKPIVVARNSKTGLSLIFLCDKEATTYIAGQFHGWDTAHDWAFGADLRKGQAMRANARMVCRPLVNVDKMQTDIDDLWTDFISK